PSMTKLVDSTRHQQRQVRRWGLPTLYDVQVAPQVLCVHAIHKSTFPYNKPSQYLHRLSSMHYKPV
ncbi:hypothetical protein JI435_077870, partial [Parastagonospora nodorum SN15]